MSDNLKFGLTVLAVLGGMIYTGAKAIHMDFSIPDLVAQLVQLATDVLRGLLH
ncbi:hypothetical protein [Cupriavidus basilensis]|uniref:hypothetical protein n=1 Tax=Cupriavidus basilensis TaxID=68895 RepID=UPI0023E7E77C|nr:hypothetical protein [Cupriavidus basilensis]MDF3888842.1 hypothetical protein [Cupriavidus basilensis]